MDGTQVRSACLDLGRPGIDDSLDLPSVPLFGEDPVKTQARGRRIGEGQLDAPDEPPELLEILFDDEPAAMEDAQLLDDPFKLVDEMGREEHRGPRVGELADDLSEKIAARGDV